MDRHESFIEALKKEWILRSHEAKDLFLESVYFGGGTPALLSPKKFEEVLSLLPLRENIEITLEANPENLTKELLLDFRKVGINRLSIGAQTFDDELLPLLGRTHSAKKIIDATRSALKAGFENISIDLMYDLPHQTLTSWQKTLKVATGLPIHHISLYNLTIEPYTPFFKNKKRLEPYLPTPEHSLAMYQNAQEHLSKNGFEPYEISAFARPGHTSHHNIGYWTARPFLGLGPSAFSFWKNVRFRNVAHLNKYLKALDQEILPTDFVDEIDKEARQRELLAVEIRLRQGVHLSQFQARHGTISPELCESIKTVIKHGWVHQKDDFLFLTQEGILFYDSVAVELIADTP